MVRRVSTVSSRWVALWRSRGMIALLVNRDLRVRYSTSVLGYLWTILDPLLSALVYWFVFTVIFVRAGVGESPYIVFLLAGLLPWTWASSSIQECTRALTAEAKLVRSSNIPREVWVLRVVFSKFMEFLFSLPVIAAFAIFAGAKVSWYLLFLPLALLVQGLLLIGLGLILAPLTVLFTDLQRLVRIALRIMFYLSPIIYGITDVPEKFRTLYSLNPFSGIIDLIRASFFPDQFASWGPFITASAITLVVFALGIFVFRTVERAALKEI